MTGAVARAAEIVDNHFRASARKLECIGAAKSTSRPGNDRDAVLEADGHNEKSLPKQVREALC
jgi:hypothetical protein